MRGGIKDNNTACTLLSVLLVHPLLLLHAILLDPLLFYAYMLVLSITMYQKI